VGIVGHNDDSTNREEVDDDSLSIEEILGPVLCRGISTGGDRNAEAALQDLDKLGFHTNGSRIVPKQSRLDNGAGDSQSTRGMRDGSPPL
jgi:hypothetical protein